MQCAAGEVHRLRAGDSEEAAASGARLCCDPGGKAGEFGLSPGMCGGQVCRGRVPSAKVKKKGREAGVRQSSRTARLRL